MLMDKIRMKMAKISFKKLLITSLLTSIATMPLSAIAKPAGFYYWQSKTSNERVCLQFAPDKGWVKVNGPYKDANCRVKKRT